MALNLRGDARSGFANKTAAAESGGNNQAQSPSSSASGRYQFTDDTFQGFYKQVFGRTLSAPQLAQVKNDPAVQDRLMAAAEQDYTARLTHAGLDASDGNKRLLHFFGPTGIAVLRAAPATPIAEVVGDAAMRANPQLAGKTTGQVVENAHRAMGHSAPGRYNNGEPLPQASPFSSFDPNSYYEQGLGVGPLDARRPVEARHDAPITEQALRAKLLGNVTGQQADSTPAGLQNAQAVETQELALQAQKDGYGVWDKFQAGFSNNSLAAALYRAIDRQHPEATPEWSRHYLDHSDKLDAPAQNEVELATLRDTTSQADYDRALADIQAKRQRQFIQYSGGSTSGILYGLAGGVADPAGWAAGLGVGKAFQLAGVSARALYLSGRMAAAGGALVGEGALGNVAVTAGLDLAGEHMTSTDYAAAAGFGMGIGALAAPLHLRGIHNAEVRRTAEAIQAGGQEALERLRARAVANVGDGDAGQVSQEMRRLDVADMVGRAREAVAPVEDAHRLAPSSEAQVMHMDAELAPVAVLEGPGVEKVAKPAPLPEGFLTADTATRDRLVTAYGLDAIPDEGTRAVAAEYVARAERLVGDSTINKAALRTILKKGNLESTSNTLLASDNLLANAWGISMLENGQGAAGRRATAAIEQNTRERVYLRQLAQYDAQFTAFRRSEGVGVMRETWTGDARRQFNRRVYAEREARFQGIESGETNRAVLNTADMLDRGYGIMGAEAKQAGIIGHARISDDSVGYQPHRISAGKVAALMENREQRRAVAALISEQLQHSDNAYEVRDGETGAVIKRAWDKRFADQFAAKYLDDAARRAQGGWDIPVNIHDPQAADIVLDAAKASALPPEAVHQLLGKFSRGGAGFTRKRLRLNLLADIPDGNGGTMQLMDLFNQDGLSLYRGYARRMSGEVALANRGILGKKGVEVYRDAMRVSGADNQTLRAFDQTAAEFLNTPFGEANHKYLDNVRVMTSMLRLGGMGFTQLGEYGNALATLGVSRTMQEIGSFRRLAREVGQLAHGADSTNAILKDVDNWAGGVGVTEYHFTRLYDVPDNDIQPYNGETIGIGTRLVRAGGNLQAVLSGHRMITAVQVRGMAEAMTRKAFEFVRSGKDDVALRDAGITPELQTRLHANLDRIATFDGDRLGSVELHAGDLTPGEVDQFRQAIFRSANQMIQHTFTGETGRWAHNGMLKLLTQFRTFGLISIEKQWGRNRTNHGALKSFAYLIGAMSFAAPITLARLHMHTIGMSRGEREKYLQENLTLAQLGRATLGYASSAGIAGDLFDVGNGFASGWAGQDYAESVGIRGQGQGGVSRLVPALGSVEDIWAAAHGNPHKLARVLPFGSLPFVQPALNAVSPTP